MAKKKEEGGKEICGVCKYPIFLNSDNYCHLIDYFQGKFYGEGYYHSKCYNEKLSGGQELKTMKKATWNLLQNANKLFGNSGRKVDA